MAFPTFHAVSNTAGHSATTAGMSVPWPTGYAVNDIGILFIETNGGAATPALSTPASSGWTAFGTVQTTGTGTAGTKIHMFWRRADSLTMSSPFISASTDHLFAVMATFRGCITTGNPFDTPVGGVKAAASTSITMPQVTTTSADSLIVYAMARDVTGTAAWVTSVTNANLGSITERFDTGTASGTGGGLAIYTGTKLSAGGIGSATATVTSSINAWQTIALKPQPTTIDQTAYGFYADGTESGSTALVAQDTPYTSDGTTDITTALRVRLQETAGMAGVSTDDYQLQYAYNGGEYTNVGAIVGDDYYPTNRQTATASIYDSTSAGVSQSFTGNGKTLTSVAFMLAKGGAPTGTAVAKLYAHTGTFGTSSLPTGTALATSNTLDVSTLTTTLTLTTLIFAGVNQYALANGTKYVITLEYGTSTSANVVQVGLNSSASSHPGNEGSLSGGAWNAVSSTDAIFYINPRTVVNAFASASLTDGGATTNRLGAGTGSFVAGEVSETGVVTDHLITASNYTEHHYSINIPNAEVERGDFLQFRVARNGVAGTYTRTPTIYFPSQATPTLTTTYQGASYLTTHTISAFNVSGTNPALFVAAFNKNPTVEDGGITANSVAMTMRARNENANVAAVTAYDRLINNASVDITATMTTAKQQGMVAILVENVDQTTPVVNSQATAGTFSRTATTTYSGTKGNLLLLYIATQATATLTPVNNVQLQNFDHPGADVGQVYIGYIAASGGLQTLGVTLPANDNWRLIVVEVAPAAAGAPTTTTQNQTGVARIETSATKDQTGKARITETLLKTQTGISRITVSNTVLQTGISRVTRTFIADVTGVSRITRTFTALQLGLSRISILIAQDIPGVARLLAAPTATTKDITGVGRIQATATQNITGVARITTVGSQAQTGKSRIQVSVQQVVTGTSRITVSTPKTQTGVTRIEVSVQRTQAGTGRVTVTTSQNQTATSRVTVVSQQNQTGVASIPAVSTRPQTGTADVQVTTTRAIDGVSRVTIVLTRTQTGVSAITQQFAQDIAGIARVEVASQRTQTGLGAVLRSFTQDVTGKARIAYITSQNVSGISRITIVLAKPINGVSRIQLVTDRTQTGTSRVTVSTVRTQNGTARISVANLAAVTGVARIEITSSGSQTGLARIQHIVLRTQTGVARIALISNRDQSGIARVQTSVQRTVTGVSRLTATNTQDITGKADIQRSFTADQSGRSRITISTLQTQLGKSAVFNAVSQSITGVGRVLNGGYQPQTGVARIQATSTRDQTGKASVSVSTQKAQYGDARITRTSSATQTGKASVQQQEEADQSGRSRLVQTTSRPQSGTGDIKAPVARPQTGAGYIGGQFWEEIEGKAAIARDVVHTQRGQALIVKPLVVGESATGVYPAALPIGEGVVNTAEEVTATAYDRGEQATGSFTVGQEDVIGSWETP